MLPHPIEPSLLSNILAEPTPAVFLNHHHHRGRYQQLPHGLPACLPDKTALVFLIISVPAVV